MRFYFTLMVRLSKIIDISIYLFVFSHESKLHANIIFCSDIITKFFFSKPLPFDIVICSKNVNKTYVINSWIKLTSTDFFMT